jgi:hypothetical protein
VALSSTETETYSLAHCIKEALWLCMPLLLLNIDIPDAYPLLCNNQAAIFIANTEFNDHCQNQTY